MTSSREKNWIDKVKELQFHHALENCCILHLSSIQYSQCSLLIIIIWCTQLISPKRQHPSWEWGQICFPSFFATSILYLLHSCLHPFAHFSPPSLEALPTTSAQTDPFAEPAAPVVLATQPRSPCDICCVGIWLTGAFQLLPLKQTIGQRPYFILFHTVIALSKMAFDKYSLNKYLFNRPNNLAKDIWNKTASHLGNTITCKAGSF